MDAELLKRRTERLQAYLEENLPDWQQAEPEDVPNIVRLVIAYEDQERLRICGLTEQDELVPAEGVGYTAQQWLYRILGLSTEQRVQAMSSLWKRADVANICDLMNHRDRLAEQAGMLYYLGKRLEDEVELRSNAEFARDLHHGQFCLIYHTLMNLPQLKEPNQAAEEMRRVWANAMVPPVNGQLMKDSSDGKMYEWSRDKIQWVLLPEDTGEVTKADG